MKDAGDYVSGMPGLSGNTPDIPTNPQMFFLVVPVSFTTNDAFYVVRSYLALVHNIIQM